MASGQDIERKREKERTREREREREKEGDHSRKSNYIDESNTHRKPPLLHPCFRPSAIT